MLNSDNIEPYQPDDNRYSRMPYTRCGNSGLLLPKISLGLWQNFGDIDAIQNARNILYTAFNLGITHFDLANNYGTPYGSAEQNFGKIFKQSFKGYRDELIISSKAGYDMWPGPYGVGGSRKYLLASCEQSLKRTGLEYFDIFYHHCPDDKTPLTETVGALMTLVKQGKALYIGISNYPTMETQLVIQALKSEGVPLLVHQPKYNMFDRWIEQSLSQTLLDEGVGAIVYSPLAQGLLTDKYLDGIPQDSRMADVNALYLNQEDLTNKILLKISQLNALAASRGQSLAQMSIAWSLNNPAVTSCLIGASKPQQLEDSFFALNNIHFTDEELTLIDSISLKDLRVYETIK